MLESKCFNSKCNVNHDFSSTADLFNQLFSSLNQIYWIENSILKILPDWNRAIRSSIVDKAMSEYHLTVAEHVYQLENIFQSLKLKAKGKISPEMAVLLKSEISPALINSSEANLDREFTIKMNGIIPLKIKLYETMVDITKALKLHTISELFKQNLSNEYHAGHVFFNFKNIN